MIDPLSALILGLVQALTEFLPVSSSGHLVLGQTLLGVKQTGAAFEVAVHFGTLLSVALVYRKDVASLLGAVLRPRWAERWRDGEPDLRLAAAIVAGCLPAGLVGVLFKDELEALFDDPHLVCVALLVTGVVLLLTRLPKPDDRPISLRRGLAIGVAQALAIIPGVSRSGSTIATGLFLGVDREQAARYSFLMSLPVIFGATLLKGRELLVAPPPAGTWTALGVGAVVSFVAGVGALLLLLGFVRRGWFAHFGWYCLAVGGIGVFLV